MKNFLSLSVIFVFALCISMSAQTFTKKGTIEVGGSVGFSSTTFVTNGTTGNNSLSDFRFTPNVGYWIMDGLELDLGIEFGSSSIGAISSNSFGGIFEVEYYFDMKSKLYPFVGLFVGYASSTDDNGTTETTLSGINFGTQVGLAVQVANNVVIDFEVEYRRATRNPENWSGDRNGFNAFGIDIGFLVFFDTN